MFNNFLIFDLNTSAVVTALYLSYYLILEPVAAVGPRSVSQINPPINHFDQILYAPQMIFSLLSATAYAYRPDGIRNAIIVQVVSWIAQFLGHGLAEGRAPALLDNVVGGRFHISYQ